MADFQAATNNSSWIKDATATYTEGCFPLSVTGRVTLDSTNNCLVDSLEPGFIGQLIEFKKTTDSTLFYSMTYDSLGSYRAYLDTGAYTVRYVNNYYWQSCLANQQIITDTNYVLQEIDWSIDASVSCPLLEVDIAAPFLRTTGGGSAYTISYCNKGTIPAQSAYVEVDIDASLTVTSSSLPIINQVGNTYTFNVGTVNVGACGRFSLQVVVDTSALFQQTHCTEVHIYPDSICNVQWGGPIVEGTVSCQNNVVDFVVANTGTAMLSPCLLYTSPSPRDRG